MVHTKLNSPIGELTLVAERDYLTGLYFDVEGYKTSEELGRFFAHGENTVLQKTVIQLKEYFNKKRIQFHIPVRFNGTYFQEKVWNELMNIPFGKTASYLDIAKRIGDEKAVRAVGRTNGRNPISIIYPCHRVIGSNGKLTGYGGGIERKAWLLKHEGATIPGAGQISLFDK